MEDAFVGVTNSETMNEDKKDIAEDLHVDRT